MAQCYSTGYRQYIRVYAADVRTTGNTHSCDDNRLYVGDDQGVGQRRAVKQSRAERDSQKAVLSDAGMRGWRGGLASLERASAGGNNAGLRLLLWADSRDMADN